MFGMVLVSAIILGLTTQRTPPGMNEIHIQLEDRVEVFNIESAAYGIHKEGETYFLTVSCGASRQLHSPSTCKLEFSIPFASDPKRKLTPRSKFQIPVYDEVHGNLTCYYYLGFDDISGGQFRIHGVTESTLDGSLIANGGSLRVRAQFDKLDEIARSFD